MDQTAFSDDYATYIASLKARLPLDDAMRAAVGTDFDANGIVERELLRHYGLASDHYLVDVGCGSGRLAVKLRDWLRGPYLGVDINADLLAYARAGAGRGDWRFELGSGFAIPEADACADFVSFFSVFTHLLHEQSYVYLQEARRVLKPGGRVVFSFIEFASAHQWKIFEENVRDLGRPVPLNMFVGRDAIGAWAAHLPMRIVDLRGSTTPHIPLSEPVRYDNGTVVDGYGWLGQSICVLEK
ncbi:MAG: class I SAM-dependent methyltransferase [Burkholderiales bacterium]